MYSNLKHSFYLESCFLYPSVMGQFVLVIFGNIQNE